MQLSTRVTVAGSVFFCAFCMFNARASAQQTSSDVDDVGNAYQNVQPPNGQPGWFWSFDQATGGTMFSDTSSYPVYDAPQTPSGPTMDGASRLFYVHYQATDPSQTPGERYSTAFGNAPSSAVNIAYEAYIYLQDPENVATIEMDTNHVWNSNGDVMIFGLQCVASANTWEFTTNVNGSTHWNPPPSYGTQVPCNPQNWTANTWHHVQLVVHSNGQGDATYDSITVDGVVNGDPSGNTPTLNGWYGNSSYSLGWGPVGLLLLNFQLDGINNNQQPASMTVYVDGMNLSWW